MPEEHVKQLVAARERLLADRRGLTEVLAKPYERGKTERWQERFVTVQATIEAIDRALQDERHPAEGRAKSKRG